MLYDNGPIARVFGHLKVLEVINISPTEQRGSTSFENIFGDNMACGTHFKQGFNVQVPNPEPIFPYF
jgi:hypothetical protein